MNSQYESRRWMQTTAMPKMVWLPALHREKTSWYIYFFSFVPLYKALLWLYFLFWRIFWWITIKSLFLIRLPWEVVPRHTQKPLCLSICMLVNRSFSKPGFVLPVVSADWIAEEKLLGEKCAGRHSETEVFFMIWFLYIARTLRNRPFTTGKQRIVLMHENTALHRAVRSISQISNATTSCSKGKRKQLLKQSKAKQPLAWQPDVSSALIL